MPEAGKDTSEFQVTQSSSAWAIVSMVLGFIITVGSSVAQTLGVESKLGIVVGALVTMAGTFLKTFTSLGYIKSRTEVKTTESAAGAVNTTPTQPGTP